MNTKYLEYFLCINEQKSISQAAQKLFISQPTLSQHIQKLEKHLGVEVFDRTSTPLSLTYAGEKLLKYAEEILDLEKQLIKEMNDISGFIKGRTTIGISPMHGYNLLPHILPKYKEKYPNIEIILIEENAQTLESLAEKGDVDLIISNLPIQSTNLDYEMLCLDQILLAVPENLLPKNIERIESNTNLVFLNERIDLNLIKNHEFLLLREGHRIRQISDNLFEDLKFCPKIFLESRNIETLFKLTSLGMGITFMPQKYARNLEASFNNETLKLPQDNDSKMYTIYFSPLNNVISNYSLAVAYSSHRKLSMASKKFIELLKEFYKDKQYY
ncbi:MAG: LysR family transcriptional regulator [Tissierellia bacterium]|nr:LysR family transcriptional regulator [Tissierellia bacterium]